MEEIGALWERTSKKNTQYWTGNVETKDGTVIPIIMFKKEKTKDTQPSFTLYFRDPAPQGPQQQQAPQEEPPF